MPAILLVEDDHDLRKMLLKLLEREGYNVEEASNGIEALNKVNNLIPDLVITDIIMPEQDGIGTINQLKKISKNIKIIAISGGGRMLSEDYLNIAKMLGASHTFTKPFSNSELLDKVSELIHQ
jgi:CheY-like chemotaxis protein